MDVPRADRLATIPATANKMPPIRTPPISPMTSSAARLRRGLAPGETPMATYAMLRYSGTISNADKSIALGTFFSGSLIWAAPAISALIPKNMGNT